VWIVAYNTQNTNGGRNGGRDDGNPSRGKCTLQTEGSGSHAPDRNSERLQGESVNIRSEGKESNDEQPMRRGGEWQENWPEVATRLCRVDARISNRVDRLKSLGNSIVPQVAYELMQAILKVERDWWIFSL
jgi:DNA (cytosine-5)-methyltransferase 1